MFTTQSSYRVTLLVALTLAFAVTVASLVRAVGGFRAFW